MAKKKIKNKLTPEKKVKTPHDFFIQSTLTNETIAHDFFNAHLTSEIRNIVDLSALKHCTRSFISRRFKKLEADVLYQAKVNGEPAYLYILLEAQSTVDKMLPFRLLSYLVEIMRYHTEKLGHTDLPFVFPLVLYSGKKNYTGPRTFAGLFKGREDMVNKVFTEPFELIDIQRMSDEEIKGHQYSGLFEFALKYSKAKDFIQRFKDSAEQIKIWLDRAGVPIFNDVWNYIMQCLADTDLLELKSVLDNEFSEEMREAIMGSIAQKWEKQGIEKGMQKGLKEGLERGLEQGLEQGLEKGREEGRREGLQKSREAIETIARNMLNAGAKLDFVHKMTKVSLIKLKEIQATLKPKSKTKKK